LIDPKNKKSSIIRTGMTFAPGVVAKLKTAGVTQVTVHQPGFFEVACAQICGGQHYTMRAAVLVLSQDEFDKKFPAAPHAPTPSNMAMANAGK
jgi:heme/copper-type cytochrome/quinol oxidase subunit 2